VGTVGTVDAVVLTLVPRAQAVGSVCSHLNLRGRAADCETCAVEPEPLGDTSPRVSRPGR
jgi:hypothetical protein